MDNGEIKRAMTCQEYIDDLADRLNEAQKQAKLNPLSTLVC